MGYTERAPKAGKLTAEQVTERRAASYAAADARVAAERAEQLAKLAEQPVPEHATWVYDSATGERVGYLTAAGVVPLPTPPRTDRVVIIPCGAGKLDHAAPAGELYTSAYFAGNLRAARALGGRVLVLSALHGLLDLDQVVEPYNLRMGQQGSVTPEQVRQQAMRLGIRAAAVTVLAGKAYADVITAVWPNAERPYDGSRGIGDHQARAKRIAEQVELDDQQAPAEVPGEPRPALPALLVVEQPGLFEVPLLLDGLPRRRGRGWWFVAPRLVTVSRWTPGLLALIRL